MTTEDRLTTLEVNYLGTASDLLEIRADVKEIRRTLAGRPSWAITAMLTVLSSTTVGLAVSLVSHMGG